MKWVHTARTRVDEGAFETGAGACVFVAHGSLVWWGVAGWLVGGEREIGGVVVGVNVKCGSVPGEFIGDGWQGRSGGGHFSGHMMRSDK